MNCKLCNKESEHLELHHIIPKSRGGSDKDSNLIEICASCHGLAHDVSFTNNRGGLISEGTQRRKIKLKAAKKWMEENEELVEEKLIEVYNSNEKEWELMMCLIETNRICADNLMDWITTGRMKIKTSFTFGFIK